MLQNHEPLLPTPVPERPWQKVGIDLFELPKKQYFLILDFFSRYIEIAKLKHTACQQRSLLKQSRRPLQDTNSTDCGIR